MQFLLPLGFMSHEGTGMMVEVPRVVPHHRGERIKVHGGWLSFLAVGDQTNGAYALIETANDPATGVRLHVHEREDETWFILEGAYVFQVGEQTISAQAGDYVFGPRSVPHSYSNRSAAVARALIMVTPAGFEGFWRESTSLGSDADAHAALGRQYGVRFVTDPKIGRHSNKPAQITALKCCERSPKAIEQSRHP